MYGWQVPPQQHEGEIRADSPSAEIQRLQEQNAGLRNAVSQMRREMEMLSAHLPSAQPEECSKAKLDPTAGGDTAPPGEQGERQRGTSGDVGTDRAGRAALGRLLIPVVINCHGTQQLLVLQERNLSFVFNDASLVT